ncbi:unnamed protein product, partial [Ixodes pacificus]
RNHDRSKWLAHGHHSEVFQVVSLLKRTILKIVPIMRDFTAVELEALTLGIESHLRLSTLRYGMQYRATNFIEIQRIGCVYDRFPEWLLKNDKTSDSCESLVESLASDMTGKIITPVCFCFFFSFLGTNRCCLTYRFIVFELCFAGKPLSRITVRFRTRLLILTASTPSNLFYMQSRALSFPCLERITSMVELITSTETSHKILGHSGVIVGHWTLGRHFQTVLWFGYCRHCSDGTRATTRMLLEQSVITSPNRVPTHTRSPRFSKNVKWLVAVLDCVMLKLRSEVPETRASAEKAVFDELQSLQDQLRRCSSVDEFITISRLM